MRTHGFEKVSDKSWKFHYGTIRAASAAEEQAGHTVFMHVFDFNWSAGLAAKCQATVTEFYRSYPASLREDPTRTTPPEEARAYEAAMDDLQDLPRYLEYCLLKMLSIADVVIDLVPKTNAGEVPPKQLTFKGKRKWYLEEEGKRDPEVAELLTPVWFDQFFDLRNALVHRPHHRQPILQLHPDGDIDVAHRVTQANRVVTGDIAHEIQQLNTNWCGFLDQVCMLFGNRLATNPLLKNPHTEVFSYGGADPSFKWAYPVW